MSERREHSTADRRITVWTVAVYSGTGLVLLALGAAIGLSDANRGDLFVPGMTVVGLVVAVLGGLLWIGNRWRAVGMGLMAGVLGAAGAMVLLGLLYLITLGGTGALSSISIHAEASPVRGLAA